MLVDLSEVIQNWLPIGTVVGVIAIAVKLKSQTTRVPTLREGKGDFKIHAAEAALKRQEVSNSRNNFTVRRNRPRPKFSPETVIPGEREGDLKVRAARAALKRQEALSPNKAIPVKKNRPRKKFSPETLEIFKLNKEIKEKGLDNASHSPPVGGEEALLASQALVYSEGGTGFWIIPTLSNSDHTRQILRRIAKEFLPIIEQRGYRVRSVSEYYLENGRGSASDGLHFELGGNKRSVQPGDRVQGYDMEHTSGYNRVSCIPCSNNYGPFRLPPECTIHLRLREPHNVNYFMRYEEVVQTMAHELAHCVHQNHRAEFWKLTEEILDDYNAQNPGFVKFVRGAVDP